MGGKLTKAERAGVVREWLWRQHEIMRIELAIWHERYPTRRLYIQEEARARIEKREPNYPPPVCIGAALTKETSDERD